MKFIEGDFISYKKNDNDAAGDGKRQSEYVDEWEYLIFENVPQGDPKIIAKHKGFFLITKFKKTTFT